MHKAVFLDRDGTLIKEKNYLHKPDEIELEEKVISALQKFSEQGFLLFMVTNQSGIGQGLFKVKDFLSVQSRLLDMLSRQGIYFKNFYYCPHHPTKAKGKYKRICNCRKPKPGMLIKAIKNYNIDVSRSFMIGDKLSDIEAGNRLGLKTVLVLSGYGAEIIKKASKIKADYIARDLEDAAINYLF